MDKLIIGLTGLIGSGKSLVAQILQNHGAFIIDTDKIAHELTQSGGYFINQLVGIFGDSILTTTQELDRVQLRKLVFGNDNYRAELEALLHPAIKLEVDTILQKTMAKYIIIVVPLLFKSKTYLPIINRSIFVDCPEEILIERVMQRNKMTKIEVLQILSTQPDRNIQLKLATDIIVNDGTVDELKNKVMRLHSEYCMMLSSG